MSAENEREIADPIHLSALNRQKIVVGAKRLHKALLAGKAERVYLAKDADPAITEPIAALCRQNAVVYAWVPSMADLGRACGIEVGAAAAAILLDSAGETP